MKKRKDAKQDVSRREFVKSAAVGLGATALAGLGAAEVDAAKGPAGPQIPRNWDHVADVVVVGSGAAGLPASIEAIEHGASVIIVEQNYDIGGHAIQSGAGMPWGGGTAMQKKYGIDDSVDRMFEDLVSWPDYRFSDRDMIRTFCEESVPSYEFLEKHGVVYRDQKPGWAADGPHTVLRSVGPEWSGEVSTYAPTGGNGVALMRPLEASARKLGVQILLQHSLTGVIRTGNFSGRVVGITAMNQGKTVNIQAKKGVILATGGHTSNVNFRRMFDARLTEEYQVVGEPYSKQSGDGEIAALRVGAALWGLANQTLETTRTHVFEKPYVIGNRYGYPQGGMHRKENLKDCPVKDLARAIGLQVADYQNLIHVNQVGARFVNEFATGFDWWNPCLSLNGATKNGGGPIWAIFDAEGAKREKWTCGPPFADPDGFFFTANTLADLAANIKSKYQKQPMPGAALAAAVERYNSFVDAGKDADFGKPAPKYKIQTAPFYAAWSTPCVHDCLSGLHINTKSQVLDTNGEVIPGLYGGGETTGGFNQHGLAKCIVQGRIAGREAAQAIVS